MKIVVILAFVLIAASMAFALFFMLRGDPKGNVPGKRMAWALTVRIAVSVAVFLCILLAWKLGYIQPHGIPLCA